jgi:hypothetical protein
MKKALAADASSAFCLQALSGWLNELWPFLTSSFSTSFS